MPILRLLSELVIYADIPQILFFTFTASRGTLGSVSLVYVISSGMQFANGEVEKAHPAVNLAPVLRQPVVKDFFAVPASACIQ